MLPWILILLKTTQICNTKLTFTMKNLCATTTTAAGTTISLAIDTTASIWHIVTSLYATNTSFGAMT